MIKAMPGKRVGTHCTVGWVGLRDVLDGCWKSHPHRHLTSGPTSP